MWIYPKQYDVIVIGSGHAGVEAALAAARMGCTTLLLTINLDTVGQMSCNPAIGGPAKGHLVREIDALGGEMAKNTDMTGLQFRILNSKKGSSVRAPRAQCDKKAYQFRLKWICERQANLDCKQAQTTTLLVQSGKVCGVETLLGITYMGQTMVVTTGTFLRALMHIGENKQPGGRAGEGAATALSTSLTDLGIKLGRLKTGTPPRLAKRSLDFSRMEPQAGDEPVPFFSYWRDDLFHMEHAEYDVVEGGSSNSNYPPGSILNRLNGQMACFITFTTDKTAEIIRTNLHKSPMYSGVIEGVGPRYCPSIEDKIVKFPDKIRQQLFLEPEGIATDEFYVNGFSTCLPYDIQVAMVRSVIGCENAELMRPAYAVEYDFALPTQLLPSLESKVCDNLYLAGQINGTSGYEEAAAQGLMAGINAARRVQEKQPIILRRDQAYIGVLIDDLVTKGTAEPYRMFTSRAEYRLVLRQDNADTRLAEIGYQIGLLPERNYQSFKKKRLAIDLEINRLKGTRIGNNSLAELLRRPELSYGDLPIKDDSLGVEVTQQVEDELKYHGYVERQGIEVARFKTLEDKQIPRWLDYNAVHSLRPEARQKLIQVRPHTLGQASRISGVSPSDISLLMIWMKRGLDAKSTTAQ